MSGKNSGFAAGLATGIDMSADPPPRRSGIAANVLTGRTNRLAEMAAGSVITRTQDFVDPARCKMWSGHNRDYGLLTEERCADLLESLKAQGRQEMPAIVRRVSDDPSFDFEVICGARRHWSISWLRKNNYPDFRFLVDIRELGDEEAFRLADIENRARDDLTDLERARDYLRALNAYYAGRQKAMAERLNVSESWLSRYLDLARLPTELLTAFVNPQELGIRNVIALKALLRDDRQREKVFVEAANLAAQQRRTGQVMGVLDVIRILTEAAAATRAKASPKKSGKPVTVSSSAGKPVIRIDGHDRGGIRLTLLHRGGATRADAEQALRAVLEQHWA